MNETTERPTVTMTMLIDDREIIQNALDLYHAHIGTATLIGASSRDQIDHMRAIERVQKVVTDAGTG